MAKNIESSENSDRIRLSEEELKELKQELGIKESDNTVYLEVFNEKGESIKYHFPKERKFLIENKEGGMKWADLKEAIKRKKEELGI